MLRDRLDRIDDRIDSIHDKLDVFYEFKGEIRVKVSILAAAWGVLGGAIPAGIALMLKYSGAF